MKIANKNCREYVQRREPFQGSNLWGAWIKSTLVESSDEQYVVFSYGHHFPIYIFDQDTQQWFANKDKYSLTTTRHQSQARPISDGTQLQWLDTRRMIVLATIGYTEFVKRRVIEGVV